MFSLGTADRYLRRHRLFESNLPLVLSPFGCAHPKGVEAIGVYGHSGGIERRRKYGTTRASLAEWKVAMDIDWMTGSELAESIPPAYTKWIGEALLAEVESRRTAQKETSR